MTKIKLYQTVKALGFRSMAHFFTRSMETLLEQIDAGQRLIWPLRFEQQRKGSRTTTEFKDQPKPVRKRLKAQRSKK